MTGVVDSPQHAEISARSLAFMENAGGDVMDTDSMYDRIEKPDANVDAFVSEPGRRERLRSEGAAVLRRWPDPADRPALFGVPVGVKDVIHVDGLPTRAGSALPPEALAGRQAPVVDRLRRAGALVAGKTATAEFAVSAPAPTRNPHSPQHTPGGSSSGSAAAVAAGMVPLAVGTQTIGSMIRPAAYCGVVGFKPTYGRIPTQGVIANAPTFDTVGLFAAHVAGVIPAAQALCDHWRPVVPAVAGPVLGVPDGPYLERADPDARSAFDDHTRQLADRGCTVRRIPFPGDFEDVVAHQFLINRYELAQVHAAWFPRYGELYREETVRAIRVGQKIGKEAYDGALRAREVFRERVRAAMVDAAVDAWLTPAATGPAPRGLGSTGNPIMCLPWSFAGMPAVSVPAGSAPNGLPLGLQLVAAPCADEELLAMAGWVEVIARPGRDGGGSR